MASELSVAGADRPLAVLQESVRAIFDPERLRGELEFNLPDALRRLADAIDAGDMDGSLAGFTPWGFQGDYRDTRAHFIVKLHLAAGVRKSVDVQSLEKVG